MKKTILAIFVFSLLSCGADDDSRQAPLDGLQHYLNLKKLSRHQLESVNGALINKERKQTADMEGNPVSLIHSIKLITGGTNEASSRQAFLVQESFTQADAMSPEHDHYMCTILVFISRQDQWELENNDMFVGNRDEAGAHSAKPCDGFVLIWENEFPVLSRGGWMEKVYRKDGTYVLEVLEQTG